MASRKPANLLSAKLLAFKKSQPLAKMAGDKIGLRDRNQQTRLKLF